MASFVLKVYNAPGGDYRETVNVSALEEFKFEQLHETIRGSVPDIDRFLLTWEDPDKEYFVLKNDKHLREALNNLHRTQDGKLALKIHLICVTQCDENRFVDVKVELLDDSSGDAAVSANQIGGVKSKAADLPVLKVVKMENLNEFPENANDDLVGGPSTDYLTESPVRTPPVSYVAQQYRESLASAIPERSNSALEPVASSSGSARPPKQAKGCDGFFFQRKRHRKSGRRSSRRAKQGRIHSVPLPIKPSASGQKAGGSRSTKKAKKTTPSEESEHLNVSAVTGRMTRRASKQLVDQARAKQTTLGECTNSSGQKTQTDAEVTGEAQKSIAAEEPIMEGGPKSAKHPSLAAEKAEEKQPEQTPEESGEQELESRSMRKRHAAAIPVHAGGKDQRDLIKEPEEKRSRRIEQSNSENDEKRVEEKEELHSKIVAAMAVGDKPRIDMAVGWLNEEYAAYHGFNNSVSQDQQTAFEKYDQILTGLLTEVAGEESTFRRLLLEAPLITPRALGILKQSCTNSVHGSLCLKTLQQLVINHPKQRNELCCALLDFAAFENCETRTRALELAKDLYLNDFCRQTVLEYMTKLLRTLSSPAPPSILFSIDCGRPVSSGKWSDDCVRACLYLFLELLPIDHELIHELARVYVEMPVDIKRAILRQLETPILKLGMHSTELLSLVETCPKGAETLVTRIVHLLTEKDPPSQDLVKRIRELYQKRIPDVRFLVLVLTGLTKTEIIGALPKLVKLNQNLVREVFNRLLHNQGFPDAGDKAINPAELMVALHNVDAPRDNAKSIIAAMNLLFAEKQIYTQEVLAGVIQQLTDQDPLPRLLMPTVIQALILFPRLIHCVLDILLRLIAKQIWQQPEVWEGFVKCCNRTKPQSFPVLLQLPPPQLKSIFILCPELRQPLLEYINSRSSSQEESRLEAVSENTRPDDVSKCCTAGSSTCDGAESTDEHEDNVIN